MKGIGKHDISIFGEFVDKTLEKEFLSYDMKNYSKLVGPVALIFGVIYMSFIIADYYAIERPSSFMVILIIRILFLIASVGVHYTVKKIHDYSKLVYLIASYEIWAISSFMIIIYQYGSIGFMSYFSVIAITLAVYITPNRLIFVQIISVLFNLSFLVLYSNNVENITTFMLLEIIVYILIFILFGNIEAYLTNFYRRKQFIDSRELLKLSITDSLTGIYNRVRFNQELKQWINYCNRYENPLSLVIFDIDDFKKVNDNYGHLMGDTVLQNLTLIIKKAIRSADIFARWGGEEFVILLPNTDIHQAMEITERLRILIEKNKYGIVENVTCSFGLVSLKKNEIAESLLQRADKLLYEAKAQGKNTVSYEVCIN